MKEKTIEAFVELRLKNYTELFCYELGGLEFIYRPLSFAEYNTILELEDHLSGPEINDHIVTICTLYPSNISKWLDIAKAADPDTYAQKILDESGWNSSDKMLQLFMKGKEERDELPALIELVICTVYKALRPEDIKNMTLKEQMSLYAKAELIYNAGGTNLDIESMLKQDANKQKIMPVPEGMQSTDLSKYDTPDFEKILEGRSVF